MLRTTFVACGTLLLLALVSCGAQGKAGGEVEPTAPSPEATDAFGPGCSDFPRQGPGSLVAMAEQPLTNAIAQSPLLERLSTALERSGLGRELDAAEDMTVFAPTDDAFDMYPDEEIEILFTDPASLKHVLGYHVALGEHGTEAFDDGSFDTLNGGRISTTEQAGRYTVDGYAPVVCADVRTANATVHVVDMLLIPS